MPRRASLHPANGYPENGGLLAYFILVWKPTICRAFPAIVAAPPWTTAQGFNSGWCGLVGPRLLAPWRHGLRARRATGHKLDRQASVEIARRFAWFELGFSAARSASMSLVFVAGLGIDVAPCSSSSVSPLS